MALGAIVFGAGAALAQAVGVASAGVYSQAQAGRGAGLYAAQCARCHGPEMEGLDVAPPLTGERFTSDWANQPAAALASRIRTTMPLDNPGALGLAASADIVAAILAANGYPAGPADLPANTAALQQITIDVPPGR
jgi:mono/diheme cytochrome c family protein